MRKGPAPLSSTWWQHLTVVTERQVRRKFKTFYITFYIFTASSDSSKLSSSISIVGDSRSSSSTTYQSLDTLSSSRDKRGKKKRTPTVALPVDKYKERRGISKSPSPIHEPSLSKKKEKEVAVDNFNLDKHLKDTRKNYKHLVI